MRRGAVGVVVVLVAVTVAVVANVGAAPASSMRVVDRTYSCKVRPARYIDLETSVTLSGASTNASLQIPADCIVLAVGARVVTAITGATSYEVGVSGNLSQFGSALAIAAGSTNFGLIGPTAFYTNATIIVSATGGLFTGGQVRLSISILLANPSAA